VHAQPKQSVTQLALADHHGPATCFGRPVVPNFMPADEPCNWKSNTGEGTDVTYCCYRSLSRSTYCRSIRSNLAEVINIHTIKPLDEESTKSLQNKCVVTAEEHNILES
jgi:transketolase